MVRYVDSLTPRHLVNPRICREVLLMPFRFAVDPGENLFYFGHLG